MKKGKKILTGVLAAALAAGYAMPALAAEGWNQDTTGWLYENEDGSHVTNSWKLADGKWYYFGADGYMDTGWILENGKWYFCNAGGDMLTGWVESNGLWYFCTASGAMATGWVMDNNTWYFCDASGAMLTGWVQVDGANYYLNPVSDGTRGAMKTGEVTIGGQTYHFDASGACTDTVPTPSARYYGNGNAVSSGTVPGGSSGGSSGGGGGSSSVPTTSDEGRQMNEAVKEEISNAIPEIKEQNEAITDIKMTSSALLENQTVTVEMSEELSAGKTIGDTGVDGAIFSVMETLLADENAAKIEYAKAGMTFDLTTAEGADYAREAVDAALAGIADEDLSYLEGKTYTAVITMADGGEVTYKIAFDFQ